MEAILVYTVILLIAAVVSGLLAGFFGIGGGIIMVPVLFHLLQAQGYNDDISYKVATATSLAAIIFIGLYSARQHYKLDAVDIKIVKKWAVFLMLGSFFGAILNRYLPVSFLFFVFIGVISFAALNLLQVRHRVIADKLPENLGYNGFLGSVIGCLSTWIGIGGGTLTTPILTAYNVPIHRSIGTASAIGVIIAVSATFGNLISGFNIEGRPAFSIGYVNLIGFICLATVSAWFAPIGARLAHRFDPLVLKRSFAVFLILVAVRMAMKLLA